jgi:DNA topoisomerase-1
MSGKKSYKSYTKFVGGSGKILVIVESPGKVKKIQDILGDDYIVTASVGHIIDLASDKMSVEINNNFTPNYQTLKGKEGVISDIKKLAAKTDDVLLATDEDREGEMIAWSLAYVLKLKDAKRITFNSITEQEILNAVAKPRKIDDNLVDAQKTRRILDRIVGYEISPILWKSIGQALSAGRVQSVVVKLILDREEEIEEFMKNKLKSYFIINGKFLDKKDVDFMTNLYTTKKQSIKLDDDEEDKKEKDKEDENVDNSSGKLLKGSKAIIEDRKKTQEILEKMVGAVFTIGGIGTKKSFRKPSPPFTTSTLQQEAARKLGFSIKRTMTAAQHLYEAGHITYMRTDSVSLSKEAMDKINKYVLSTFGKEYSNPTEYKGKSANTQEAHEAVRPTHIEVKKLEEKGKILSDEVRLYELIWKRSVASQMKPAIFNINTTQILISTLKDYYFTTQVSTVLFNGFLAVYNIKNVEEDGETNDDTKSISLPEVGKIIKYKEIIGDELYSKPPTRYNEASLVNKLDPENLNIGRPSTYAAIIGKIQEKEYVVKQDHPGIEKDAVTLLLSNKKIEEESKKILIGKDLNKLTPTNMGRIVTKYLVKYFPDIMDYKFTSDMEETLDKIAEGRNKWVKVLDDFYKDFHKTVENLAKSEIKVLDENKRVLGKDKDGNNVVATTRKYGPVVYIENEKGKSLNMAPIKIPLTLDTITLKEALEVLAYPKILGKIDKKEIKLYKGKFGYYVKYGDDNISLAKLNIEDESEITIDKIKELIEEKKKKYLWEGKEGKIIYLVLEGPYGRFINVTDKSKKTNKSLNVKLPEDVKIEELTMDKIKTLVEEGKKNKFKKRTGAKKEGEKKEEQVENKGEVKQARAKSGTTTKTTKTKTKTTTTKTKVANPEKKVRKVKKE